MPAPHDPPHRHRTPSTRLLGLILLTALALAVATIHWTTEHTTRRDSVADPDFIAWAVSDTEHHVNGFTLTELGLVGWLHVSGRDGSGNDVDRNYTLEGLFGDVRGDRDPSPAASLGAEDGLYENLVARYRDTAAQCPGQPSTTAKGTWSQRTVYSQHCSHEPTTVWLDEDQLPLRQRPATEAAPIADTLDTMFAAAAPDRPGYKFDNDAVEACWLSQDGGADTGLVTELDLSLHSLSISSQSWTKSHPGNDDEKNSLSRDELDPTAIATLLQNNANSYHLDIGWDDELDQFTMRVGTDDDAVYALDGTPLG